MQYYKIFEDTLDEFTTIVDGKTLLDLQKSDEIGNLGVQLTSALQVLYPSLSVHDLKIVVDQINSSTWLIEIYVSEEFSKNEDHASLDRTSLTDILEEINREAEKKKAAIDQKEAEKSIKDEDEKDRFNGQQKPTNGETPPTQLDLDEVQYESIEDLPIKVTGVLSQNRQIFASEINTSGKICRTKLRFSTGDDDLVSLTIIANLLDRDCFVSYSNSKEMKPTTFIETGDFKFGKETMFVFNLLSRIKNNPDLVEEIKMAIPEFDDIDF